MGNRVSYECDNNAPDRREDGEVSRDAQQNVDSSNMPRLRGGDTSAAMGDSTRYNGWYVDDSAGPSATDGYDPDCYEIPAPPNNLPRASSRSYKQNGPATSAPVPARGGFDFNDSAQPLPWNERIQRNEMNERSHRNERKERRRDDHGQVRRFTDCADRELLDYLAARSIAPEFLREIDLFLQGHPEIASCTEGRKMLDDLNTLSPLDAYVYFLKGYTKPARYIDGIVRTDYFQVPRSYAYILLRKKFDPELVAFFDGFDFRHDIIDRIDREVYMGIQDLDFGRKVSVSLRKLICYAVWGNPVDAYKYFEYSYQNEFMPHRYLPDHVVLGHVPKPADYAEPRPSDVGGGKKHTYVRLRMARAQDQGVDVLDVLLTEYKTALLRKGHRRVEIDRLCAAANNRLNVERRDSTGEA
ncbi:hypothetical protein EJ02DRAFT_356429 [Clathrospora elynae]|uniref:Uncharacterized protein n=1 Tax=Clathrospora elynae TaxID=706981 RepID=A0A6A5SGJ9_9PLEO|nr:hypothetical protein EJ02DRAFT_356429 [Clathrospora elynae]